jgi:hypothetical protein
LSHQKEYKNPTGGKYMIFFPPVYLLWETWEKMQALGDIILYFFPLSPNIISMRGKKYHKKRRAPLKKEKKKEKTWKRKRKVAK